MDSGMKTAAILGGVILVVIFGITIGLSTIEETKFEPMDVKQESKSSNPTVDKSRFKRAPELVGIANYINTSPEELRNMMKDKVVLYDIWTYSCINCVRTIPHITAWNEKYSDDGLLIVGIHSPEFEFEKDLNNVKMAVEKHGITYPVVLDNDWETWKAFENRYWPRKYIADHEGYIRYDHIGEGAYDETERVIQKLLEERSSSLGINVASAEPLVDIKEFEHSSFRTPELYFGYKFAQGRNQLGNDEGFKPEQDVTYHSVDNVKQHYFYLDGTWKNLEGSMRLISEEGTIKLLYHAKEVNIVTENVGELEILLDEKPIDKKYAGKDLSLDKKLITNEAGLYNIIQSESASTHLLEIKVKNPGFEIYTFTFG